MADLQAGWYPDPSGDASRLRYWNGTQWTNDYTPVTPPAASWSSPSAQTTQPPVVVQETTYTNSAGQQTRVNQVYVQTSAQGGMDSTKQNLRLGAFILNLVSTIAVGWTLLPLAWMIPMTVHSWKLYKGTRQNSTAFGVCTLLFVSVIAGILLLISGED